MAYQIDYSNDGAAQSGSEVYERPVWRDRPQKRSLVVPSIVKTGASFLTAAALFFGAEAFAPAEFRPSNLMGTYEARVHAEVKAAELTQQGKYEVWAANVKSSVEQQVEQYKAFNQGVLTRYQAAWDRGKIFATATGQLQNQYVAERMSQTRSQQSMDVSIVNMSRGIGRALELMEPGSGRGALDYADNLSTTLSDELTSAATQGVTISIEGWDTGLASVDDLRNDLAKLKPITIPAPPRLGKNVASIDPEPSVR